MAASHLRIKLIMVFALHYFAPVLSSCPFFPSFSLSDGTRTHSYKLITSKAHRERKFARVETCKCHSVRWIKKKRRKKQQIALKKTPEADAVCQWKVKHREKKEWKMKAHLIRWLFAGRGNISPRVWGYIYIYVCLSKVMWAEFHEYY